MPNITLQIVLAIAGSVALLVGLFGGGVKAKEIEVSKLSPVSRMFSIFIGIVMIGAATWLSFPCFSASPDTTPKPIGQPMVEPPASTPIPKFGWAVYFEIALKEGFWKPGTNSYEILADCPDVEYFEDVDQRSEFSVDQNAQLFPNKVVEFHFFGIPSPNSGEPRLSSINPNQRTKIILGYTNIGSEQATQAINECQVKAIINDKGVAQMSPIGPIPEN
jgi:hypothetical protein